MGNLWEKTTAFVHRKILRPMRTARQNPRYLAWSNAVGMGLAFAPFPGQIPVVVALWAIARKVKFRFSLPLAVAWTFISNTFTNLPLFYLYYRTGCVLFPTQNPLSYAETAARFKTGAVQGFLYVADAFGYRYLAGSLFYMSVFFVIGYASGYVFFYVFNRRKKPPKIPV